MTWSQLLWNLFFAFLSAFAGTVLGVIWARRQWQRERTLQAQHLRDNLIKAFRFNLDRIGQCLSYLQRPQPVIPNFRLDAATPTHILLAGRELFPDVALFDRFNWQRYQLDHVNAKLEQLHAHLAAGSATQLMPSPHDSLVQHLVTTQQDIAQLLSDYEASTSPDPH